jgi:hypothetical protein
MENNLNQNMLSQGSDFNLLNNKISSYSSPLLSNISNNLQDTVHESITREYNETESNFNKLLSKYSNLQNKIMNDTLKGNNNNKNDIELLNQINLELVTLSKELNTKLENLKETDNNLINKINLQQNILKDYHTKLISSNDEYSSYSPSLDSLKGEVDSSNDYYRYNYSWYIVWLILSIIIFYLVFSISANGFSNSNGLLIVVIALLSLYFIKKFIDYIRWSWNLKLPSWRPHINIQGPKVVFKQYIPQ